MSKSFVFYDSFYLAITELEPMVRVRLFDGICRYALYNEEPTGSEWSGVEKSIFTLIKPQLDANRKRRENGGKGGRPKTKLKPNNNLGVTNPEPNANANANVNVNVSRGKTLSKKTFTPPTIIQITDYCLERKNSVNAEKWLDHYQSNGWKVGANSMKDWKAAIRTWEQSSFDDGKKVLSTYEGTEQARRYKEVNKRKKDTERLLHAKLDAISKGGYDEDNQ